MLTRILIADSCEDFSFTLAEMLTERYSVRVCHDGVQAASLLASFCPDLLVVDLMLRGADGLHVMRMARQALGKIPLLVTSSFYPPYVFHALEELQVDYAISKPCCLDVLAQRIDELATQAPVEQIIPDSPYAMVTAALLELGMTASRAGFQYCRDAILMLREEPSLRLTKEVYPKIASRYNTGPSAVEKSIRDSIAAVWQCQRQERLGRYFSRASNGAYPRPSNHVFLSTVTERLFAARLKAL